MNQKPLSASFFTRSGTKRNAVHENEENKSTERFDNIMSKANDAHGHTSRIYKNNNKISKNESKFPHSGMMTKVQRYQLVESMLNESFPLVAVLFVIIVDVILALCSIGFQVASIVFKTELYYIACGLVYNISKINCLSVPVIKRIWVGCFVLFTNILTTLLILRRKYRIYVFTIVFKIISFLLATAQIIIFAIAISRSCCLSMNWLSIALLVCGILLKIPALVFFLVFLFKQVNFARNFDIQSHYMHH